MKIVYSHTDILGSSIECNVFDKISFLSDQPHDSEAFLESFMETQLFASFLDGRVR